MQCCQGCVEYFYNLCGSSSVSTPTSQDTVPMLTATAKKAQQAANTIKRWVNDGSLSCYIKPKITPAYISPMIGFARGGIYAPPPDHVEYIEYPSKVDMGHHIAKVKLALERYVVSDFNGGTFSVPGPYNSSANTVEKVFRDVLDAKSKWNNGIAYIRKDVAKHPGESTHQNFIKFVDEVLNPLVKEALKIGFPEAKSSEGFIAQELPEPDG